LQKRRRKVIFENKVINRLLRKYAGRCKQMSFCIAAKWFYF
jgi:hypothetical protein